MASRGNCTFHTKALMAQLSGALGLIVGDPTNNRLLAVGATPDDTPISIPVVWITGSDLTTLQQVIARVPNAINNHHLLTHIDDRGQMSATPPPRMLGDDGDVNKDDQSSSTAVLFGYLFAFALVFGCLHVMKQRRERRRQQHAALQLTATTATAIPQAAAMAMVTLAFQPPLSPINGGHGNGNDTDDHAISMEGIPNNNNNSNNGSFVPPPLVRLPIPIVVAVPVHQQQQSHQPHRIPPV
jgi:hypothetical protein